MLAWEPYVEAKALQAQGWSISAIARHLGVTRLTVRRYLNGERTPGQRARATADPFAEYVEYCRLRLGADPHLWATTLFAEVVALGYAGSYPSFTRALRGHELRPICAACRAAKTGDRALIEHPPGEETQWDYLELTDPPSQWGFAGSAFVLIGALPHSGRWRGWIAESIDQPHLIEGLDQVVRRLGGVTRRWRFDRMATVCHPDSGRLKVSFAPVAVHYQVGIDICPSRHAWRKGAVEKSAHVIAQRWWRTLADDTTVAQAQAGLDRVCARLDGRTRTRDGQRATVGALAEAEPLRPSPAPLPAVLDVERTVTDQALVAFRGNRYSVPPGHGGQIVHVHHPLGTPTLDIVTGRGVPLAHHLRAPDGAGAVIRLDEHVAALTRVVLANFSDRAPCHRKHRRPPSPEALAEADRIRRAQVGITGEQVVIDFDAYARGARPLRGRSSEQSDGSERSDEQRPPGLDNGERPSGDGRESS
jgi:transposase